MSENKEENDVRLGFNSPRNPVKVIRLKCLDCCCGSYKEVDLCTVKLCPLWPWRLGKNPYRKARVLSEEEKIEAAERLRNARSAKSP